MTISVVFEESVIVEMAMDNDLEMSLLLGLVQVLSGDEGQHPHHQRQPRPERPEDPHAIMVCPGARI
jgi:hypothetical protein